jgi:hypothetical protein
MEAYVRGVCNSRAPLEGTHERHIDGTFKQFCELCLPLSETDDSVTTLLFACFPIGTKKT